MKSKKTIKRIIVAILIGFAATGGLITLASGSEPTKVAEEATAEAAGINSEESVAAVPEPASSESMEVLEEATAEAAGSNPEESVAAVPEPVSTSPRTDQPIVMDSMLIGTAVVEGGTSFAVLQSADGTRLVREGDEIAGGVRLVQIRRNRIEVESGGGRQEIRIGSIDVARQRQIRPGPGLIRGPETRVDRGPVTQAAVDRMSELRRQMLKRRVFVSNRRNAAGAGG